MWIRKVIKQFQELVDTLREVIKEQNAYIRDLLQKLRHCSTPPATRLVLSSLIINGQFKSTTMPITLNNATDWAVLTLQPIALDSQGNQVPSKIKDGSVVSYALSDPSLGNIKVNPGNPLQLLFQGVGTAAGGKTTITAKGLNVNDGEITFTDDITVPAAVAVIPVATGFKATWDGPHTASESLPF